MVITMKMLSSCLKDWLKKMCILQFILKNMILNAVIQNLGPEEITRDIPNVGEDARKNLNQ